MDRSTERLIFYGGAALVAFLIWRRLNSPLSGAQLGKALENAGARTWEAGGDQYADLGQSYRQNVTIKVPESAPLNLAQKILIGLDRVIPGTFLSRLALT